MDDPLVVRGSESICDLQRVLGSLALGDRAGGHAVAQRLTFEEFRNEIVQSTLRADVVDRQKIWVA